MQTKNNVLSYRIGHDFHDYKLAMERDVNGFSDSNFYYQIKSEKAIEQDLVVSLLELILTKKTLMLLTLSMKYLDTLNNRLKLMINKMSMNLLGLSQIIR